jgi:hypothetical protein
MRRRIVWIVGLAAGLVLTLAVVVLLDARRSSPYSFLEGIEPIELSDEQVRDMRRIDMQYAGYTFKSNFDALYKQARAELLSKGFKEVPLPRVADTRTFRPAKGDAVGNTSEVRLQNNVRLLSPSPQAMTGWVSVHVFGGPPPGILERMGSWFGL